MPLEITRSELKTLMSGESIGITRYYGAQGCPREVGEKVHLAFRPDKNQPPEIIAEATLRSIRPFRLHDRREDHEAAKQEGWSNAYEWYGHFNRMYGDSWDGSEQIHRLQLSIDRRVDSVADPGQEMM